MPIIIAFIIIISGIFVTANVADKVLEKQIQQGFQPTPTTSPTSTPTPTPVPQTKDTTTEFSANPDPIVKCGPFKNGEYLQVTSIECKNMTSCQLGDKWIPMKKEECKVAQEARLKETIQKINELKDKIGNTVNCQTQSGWVRMTKDDCTKAQNAWGNQILDNAKQQEQTNQKIIEMFRSFENEMWQATNLDQLDNLRERLRQIQGPDPSIQNYTGTLIKIIEERIKILQKQ